MTEPAASVAEKTVTLSELSPSFSSALLAADRDIPSRSGTSTYEFAGTGARTDALGAATVVVVTSGGTGAIRGSSGVSARAPFMKLAQILAG